MENYTSILEFYILPFFLNEDNKLFFLSIIFFVFIYLIGLMVNMVIIIVICFDQRLHSPMYLFLCNLSVVDLCYTTFSVPKLLYILLSGDNVMSFRQCFVQVYLMFTASASEVLVLFIMAYDRYVAICHPFQYYHKLNNKVCIIFMMFVWISSSINSSFVVSSISKMHFCFSTTTIHQFFCDAKALFNISCGGQEMFNVVVYINYFVFGLCPIVCHLMWYIKIFRVILCINSKDGRRKAFSTCSSHLSVMFICYVSILSAYMSPPSEHSNILEEIFAVFYSTVTPMLNPIIYSLRNKELKISLLKLGSFFKVH